MNHGPNISACYPEKFREQEIVPRAAIRTSFCQVFAPLAYAVHFIHQGSTKPYKLLSAFQRICHNFVVLLIFMIIVHMARHYRFKFCLVPCSFKIVIPQISVMFHQSVKTGFLTSIPPMFIEKETPVTNQLQKEFLCPKIFVVFMRHYKFQFRKIEEWIWILCSPIKTGQFPIYTVPLSFRRSPIQAITSFGQFTGPI